MTAPREPLPYLTMRCALDDYEFEVDAEEGEEVEYRVYCYDSDEDREGLEFRNVVKVSRADFLAMLAVAQVKARPDA